jgi:hypothetical protein
MRLMLAFVTAAMGSRMTAGEPLMIRDVGGSHRVGDVPVGWAVTAPTDIGTEEG